MNKIDKLKKITNILNINFMPFNNNIKLDSEVKVIDDNFGKLIGIYNINEAINLAESSHRDLVLFNEKTNPPICKLMDYEDFLYNKFINDIIKKDFLLQKKYKNMNYKSEKIFNITHKIQIEDLKTKINKAIELLNKYEKIVFTTNTDENNLENSKSIYLTLKDLTQNKMLIYQDLVVSDENVNENGDESNYNLKIVFVKLNHNETPEIELTKEKIDELIKNYFNNNKHNNNNQLERDEIKKLMENENQEDEVKINKNTGEINKPLEEEDEFLADAFYNKKKNIKYKKKSLLEFGNRKGSKLDEFEKIFNQRMKNKYGDLIHEINFEEERYNDEKSIAIKEISNENKNSINKINNLDVLFKALDN